MSCQGVSCRRDSRDFYRDDLITDVIIAVFPRQRDTDVIWGIAGMHMSTTDPVAPAALEQHWQNPACLPFEVPPFEFLRKPVQLPAALLWRRALRERR